MKFRDFFLTNTNLDAKQLMMACRVRLLLRGLYSESHASLELQLLHFCNL